ncbi:hypothetical protein FB451DRAFT_1568819 [Mycena latifolia]|nr:hypothetical protein FB451DRAFT_1568819 [Mycena latifolia]
MLRLLSACGLCLRPSNAYADDGSTVIPNETVRLLPAPDALLSYSAGPLVDTQKPSERLGTIVRAKEGEGRKMVNVSVRTPFVMQRALLSLPPTGHPPIASAPAPRRSRRPPVLTMTRTCESVRGEPQTQPVLPPVSSCSSSGRRPELPERYMYPNANAIAYGVTAKQASTASEWFGEFACESELEVQTSAASAAGADAPVFEKRRVRPMPDQEVYTISPLVMLPVSPTLTYLFLFVSFCLQAQHPAAAISIEPGRDGAKGSAWGIAFSWSDT